MSNKPSPSIEECMKAHLLYYFEQLGDREPCNMWKMALAPAEKAILETMMLRYRSNQTRVAKALGMSRNTLREKLLQHNLIL